MQGWGVSRRDLFEAQERAALQPLPREPWEWCEWLKARMVSPNGHFRVDKNSCSVPPARRGHQVEVRRSERMLEVFACRDGQRVAVHPVATEINRYLIDANQMEDWQRDMQASKGSRYEDWPKPARSARMRKLGRIGAWARKTFRSRRSTRNGR